MVLEVAMLSPKLRTGLVVLISALWAISNAWAMVDQEYKPDPSINGAFGLVVGVLIAAGKNESKDDTQDDAPRKGRR